MKQLSCALPLVSLLALGCAEANAVEQPVEIAEVKQAATASQSVLFNLQDVDPDLLGAKLKAWANLAYTGNGRDMLIVEYLGAKQDVTGAVIQLAAPVEVDSDAVSYNSTVEHKVDVRHGAFSFSPFEDVYGAVRISAESGGSFIAYLKENKKILFSLSSPYLKAGFFRFPYMAATSSKQTDMSIAITLVTPIPGETDCDVTILNRPAGSAPTSVTVPLNTLHTLQIKTIDMGWDMTLGGTIEVSNESCGFAVSAVVDRGSKSYRVRPLGVPN